MAMSDAEFRRRAHALLKRIQFDYAGSCALDFGGTNQSECSAFDGDPRSPNTTGHVASCEIGVLLAAGAEEPLQERIARGIELFKISNRCPEVRGDAHFTGDDAEARKAHPCRHPVIISKRTGLPLSYCGRPKGHAGPHME